MAWLERRITHMSPGRRSAVRTQWLRPEQTVYETLNLSTTPARRDEARMGPTGHIATPVPASAALAGGTWTRTRPLPTDLCGIESLRQRAEDLR